MVVLQTSNGVHFWLVLLHRFSKSTSTSENYKNEFLPKNVFLVIIFYAKVPRKCSDFLCQSAPFAFLFAVLEEASVT